MRIQWNSVVVFAGLTIATAGCGGKEAAAVKTPTAVRVHAVERSASRNATRYSATINPASRVDMAFKVGGYVQRVG
ncbi:MAG TPA: hypothetical protein VIA18_17510, partial [Polyangia bacterium]|nr:hypothetical protein [Polyangia bacterium]